MRGVRLSRRRDTQRPTDGKAAAWIAIQQPIVISGPGGFLGQSAQRLPVPCRPQLLQPIEYGGSHYAALQPRT
jgi:hypothetical protein